MAYAVFIPKFQPFYKHPVPGFIVTGILTLSFLAFMAYVWAINFGPLAPGKRSGGKASAGPGQAASRKKGGRAEQGREPGGEQGPPGDG